MSPEADGPIRVSYCMLPDYPLADSIEMIRVADELGFYACYAVDETWHKDLWCLFSAAADTSTTASPAITPSFQSSKYTSFMAMS